MVYKTLLILFGISCCFVPSVKSRPSEPAISESNIEVVVDPSEYYGNLSQDTIRKIQKCDKDMDTMELCMRCAKVTKSEIVYPLCCANEDSVKTWCHDYIYFGTAK